MKQALSYLESLPFKERCDYLSDQHLLTNLTVLRDPMNTLVRVSSKAVPSALVVPLEIHADLLNRPISPNQGLDVKYITLPSISL